MSEKIKSDMEILGDFYKERSEQRTVNLHHYHKYLAKYEVTLNPSAAHAAKLLKEGQTLVNLDYIRPEHTKEEIKEMVLRLRAITMELNDICTNGR